MLARCYIDEQDIEMTSSTVFRAFTIIFASTYVLVCQNACLETKPLFNNSPPAFDPPSSLKPKRLSYDYRLPS